MAKKRIKTRKKLKIPNSFSSIQEATMKELLQEITRRSMGCLLITVLQGPKGDEWHWSTKGSPIIVGAMQSVMENITELEGLTLNDDPDESDEEKEN